MFDFGLSAAPEERHHLAQGVKALGKQTTLTSAVGATQNLSSALRYAARQARPEYVLG